MKFSDYDGNQKTDEKSKTKPTEKGASIDPKTEKMLKTLLIRYEGKSRDELLSSVLSIAQKNRREGKLSDAEIDSFYDLLAPMLDEEKRKTLDEVVEKIKKQ